MPNIVAETLKALAALAQADKEKKVAEVLLQHKRGAVCTTEAVATIFTILR